MSGKFGIIKKTIADLWYGLFCYIPGGVGIICRRVIWRKHLYQEGKKAIIQEAVKIKWGKRLHLGENVAINEFCWIEASGEIQIGNNVWIGPRTSLISFSHEHTLANHRSGGGASTYGKGKICEKIVIEDNVWIGASCVILKGVTIGEGSIVGAGSVVTRDVPAFSIVAGVPAKVINTVDKEAFFVNEDDK